MSLMVFNSVITLRGASAWNCPTDGGFTRQMGMMKATDKATMTPASFVSSVGSVADEMD